MEKERRKEGKKGECLGELGQGDCEGKRRECMNCMNRVMVKIVKRNETKRIETESIKLRR